MTNTAPLTIRTLHQEITRLKDENQSLRADLLRLQQAFRGLNQLQQRLEQITPDTDAQALLRHLLSAALEAVDAEDGSLQLLDEEKGELVFVEVQGTTREKLRGYRLPVSEGIAGWVVTQRTSQLVPDVRQEPRFSPLVDQFTGFHTTSLLCVPLLSGERILGAIELVNSRRTGPFSREDMEILMLVARLVSMALVRYEGFLQQN